jgi:hypothetical protein
MHSPTAVGQGILEWEFPHDWVGGDRARLAIDFAHITAARIHSDGKTLQVWLSHPPTQVRLSN